MKKTPLLPELRERQEDNWPGIVDDVSSRVFVELSHFSQESMIDNHIRC